MSDLKTEEIELIIETLKNYKTLIGNEINQELFKLTRKVLVTEIYFLVKDVWNNERMLKNLNLRLLCLIFQKGDIKKVTNYCGILLLVTAYKVSSIDILGDSICMHSI